MLLAKFIMKISRQKSTWQRQDVGILLISKKSLY